MTKQELLPVAQPPARVDPLQYAIQHNADPATLEKLMELQERWEAGEARKAYNAAMAAFKANPPRLIKDKLVSFGNTKYKHAQLNRVSEEISKALSLHSLFATWRTDSTGGQVTVTCRITHVGGHFEETSLSSQPDNSGGKNSIQAIGSTVSYLERYCLLALCGLTAFDDDGNSSEPINEQQVNNICSLLDEWGGDKKRFLKWAGAEGVESIQARDYDRVVSTLKERIKSNV